MARGPDKKPRKDSPLVGKPGVPAVEGTRKPQKERALLGLCSGASAATVARKLGVSERTITRWLANEGFSAELAERQARIRNQAERIIAGDLAKAARRLVKLGKGASKEDMAKVKANTELLDRGGIVKHTDIKVELTGSLRDASDEALEKLILAEADKLQGKGGSNADSGDTSGG